VREIGSEGVVEGELKRGKERERDEQYEHFTNKPLSVEFESRKSTDSMICYATLQQYGV
jgi:hypothetical protein